MVEALKDQDLTANLGLDVSVAKKTAKISGEVPNERYKNLLTAIANGINGIEGVDLSGITVAAGGDAASAAAGGVMSATQSDLDAPSGRAKAAHNLIKAEPSLADNPIDVLQKGTTVVLRGAVDSAEEHARAQELAASVEGVTGVDVSGLQVIAHAAELNVTDDEGNVVYTVQSGDTLSAIALHYYGSAGRSSYMKIAEANGIENANLIRVGQKLVIPGTTKGPEERLI
ncbi:MAG: BON domain-containing protein [Trueperaceae bacterium]